MNKYEEFRKYRGRGGAVVWLDPVVREGKRRTVQWLYRFGEDSKIVFRAKSKFDALLEAAWRNGRSGEAMDWRPTE